MNELETAILDFVHAENYHPRKPKQIAKLLKISEEKTVEFRRTVKRLARQGHILYGPNHLVGPAPKRGEAAADSESVGSKANGSAATGSEATGSATAGDAGPAKSHGKSKSKDGGGYRVTGVFRRAEGGFGFVRPAGSAPGADRKNDIYIDARDALDASTGDTVLVRINKKKTSRRSNPDGVIVEVIERESHQFVGAYFENGGVGYVQVDGKPFSAPILVGDSGAKNARPDDKVVIEMVRFPSHSHPGEGVITEILGARGTPGIDTLSIIREFNLPEEFADDALDAARDQADKFDESIPPGRVDLTGTTIITIDPVDARDFDDAISLERDEKGHWRLGVHIADVSHFVRPKTPLDREAHDRATSVYLPDRVIPMLPEVISNGLASLQPDRVRYTKTMFIEFSPEGIPVAREPMSAAIKSCRRFTYEEVDQYLADPAAWKSKLTPEVHKLLSEMHELAMILRRRRMKHGALELTMKEVKVVLDPNGQVTGTRLVENTVSHQIIEEFMLAANMAVAEFLHEHEVPFLRRVHMAPDPRKLHALTEFVTELGFQVENLESRFELQRLLGLVHGEPSEHAVNYAMLRSLQRAVYSPEEEGHYALASDCYTHFTSPIRRYPDLHIHRLFDAVLTGRKSRGDFGELAVLGEHCSGRERRAEEAERELTKVKLLAYLSTRIGDEMPAVVTGVEEFGLFVQGIELPAEGLVHVTSLVDDFYRYDRKTHTLEGAKAGSRYRLGDPVRVVVARVDADRRELDFRLIGRGGKVLGADVTTSRTSKPQRGGKPFKKPDAVHKKPKRKVERREKKRKRRG